jgi:hypothetical protein
MSNLFTVIQKQLNNRLPVKFDTEAKLKTAMKISQDSDIIPASRLKDIEKIYRVNIIFDGHTASTKFEHTIHLGLKNGYYYIIEKTTTKKKQLLNGYYYKSRILEVYYRNNDVVKVYGGKKIYTLNYDDWKKYKYVREDTHIFVISDVEDIKSFFFQYKRDRKALKEMSGNLIDLYKASSIRNHCLALFYDLSNNTMEPEAISERESEFYQTMGGIIRAVPGEYKDVIEYDVNTMYGTRMMYNKYPMKEGKICTLSELPEKIEYGIYKCRIEKSTDELLNNLFRFSPIDLYTHYDLFCAQKLNLSIELIKEKNNAIIYSTDKIELGTRLFRPYMLFMYDLKLKNAPYAKEMLSTLWGALIEESQKEVTIGPTEEFTAPEGSEIHKIYELGNKIRIVYSFTGDKKYKTNYARIGMFLTAQARLYMATTALPHYKNIIRIHTDSILTTKEIPELKIGKKLGEWKKINYKGKTCKVITSNKKPEFS